MTAALLDQQKGKVDRSALLGRLMWYAVPEATLLSYKDVVSQLTTLGLAKALPGYPEDYNVFRRASKSAERRKVAHNGHPDQFENWLIRDVASRGEDTITRRMVVEVVDPAGRKLDYAQIADIEFNKLRKTINFAWLPAPDGMDIYEQAEFDTFQPTAKQIMADVQVNFLRWRGFLHDQAIREWIRRTILAMGATPVRPSGGVYFLEEKYADQVGALEKFVADTLPPGGECHSVEIPDNEKQREMVKRAIENETVGEIERMMVEIANVRKSGHLTSKAYLEMLSNVRLLENKMNGYSKLLEKDLSAVKVRLKLLDTTAKSLAPLQGRKKRAS